MAAMASSAAGRSALKSDESLSQLPLFRSPEISSPANAQNGISHDVQNSPSRSNDTGNEPEREGFEFTKSSKPTPVQTFDSPLSLTVAPSPHNAASPHLPHPNSEEINSQAKEKNEACTAGTTSSITSAAEVGVENACLESKETQKPLDPTSLPKPAPRTPIKCVPSSGKQHPSFDSHDLPDSNKEQPQQQCSDQSRHSSEHQTPSTLLTQTEKTSSLDLKSLEKKEDERSSSLLPENSQNTNSQPNLPSTNVFSTSQNAQQISSPKDGPNSTVKKELEKHTESQKMANISRATSSTVPLFSRVSTSHQTAVTQFEQAREKRDAFESQAMSITLSAFAAKNVPLSGHTINPNMLASPGSVLEMPMTPAGVTDSSKKMEAAHYELKDISIAAKLEFMDGVYIINPANPKVVIGRDLKAFKMYQQQQIRAIYGASPNPASQITPGQYSRSRVSSSGGMLGPGGEDCEDDGHPTLLDQGPNPATDPNVPEVKEDETVAISAKAQADARPIKRSSGFSSRYNCPLVKIHPPADQILSSKSISREHLLIAYESDRDVWTALSLGKNGFFVQDKHFQPQDKEVVLKSGDMIQVGSVVFRFQPYGVPMGFASHQEAKIAKEEGISYDFEGTHTGKQVEDTGEEPKTTMHVSSTEGEGQAVSSIQAPSLSEPMESEVENLIALGRTLGTLDDHNSLQNQAASDASQFPESAQPVPVSMSVLSHVYISPELQNQYIMIDGVQLHAADIPEELHHCLPGGPKKKGPGRPPKDGQVSKREQKELKRYAESKRQRLRAENPQSAQLLAGQTMRASVGTRQDATRSGSEDGSPRVIKRKAENGAPGSEARSRKRQAREKTPDLVLDPNDYTEAQRTTKPTETYSQMLQQIFAQPSSQKGLSLKSVYKRISERWPYFYFQQGKGWESSVRHNLGSGEYRKDETTDLWFASPKTPEEKAREEREKEAKRAQNQNHRRTARQAEATQIQRGFSSGYGTQAQASLHLQNQATVNSQAPNGNGTQTMVTSNAGSNSNSTACVSNTAAMAFSPTSVASVPPYATTTAGGPSSTLPATSGALQALGTSSPASSSIYATAAGQTPRVCHPSGPLQAVSSTASISAADASSNSIVGLVTASPAPANTIQGTAALRAPSVQSMSSANANVSAPVQSLPTQTSTPAVSSPAPSQASGKKPVEPLFENATRIGAERAAQIIGTRKYNGTAGTWVLPGIINSMSGFLDNNTQRLSAARLTTGRALLLSSLLLKLGVYDKCPIPAEARNFPQIISLVGKWFERNYPDQSQSNELLLHPRIIKQLWIRHTLYDQIVQSRQAQHAGSKPADLYVVSALGSVFGLTQDTLMAMDPTATQLDKTMEAAILKDARFELQSAQNEIATEARSGSAS